MAVLLLMDKFILKRELPIGAEILNDGVHFRVWAPNCKKVDIIFEDDQLYPLENENNGYFSRFIKGIEKGALYRFRLDGKKKLFPDPASRYQPSGPEGPSQIIDYKAYQWKDKRWMGAPSRDKVILYELHIGTFTPEGTWKSAREKLSHLVDLGITVIEMMPINEFPGSFNWGYDGVNLFAPTHNYGTPDDLRAFIDKAHQLGLAVILDVVYNHFGPVGNYLHQFSDYYFKQHSTDWGTAINFDEDHNEDVRAFFLANATYWIVEFHFDGLRIDACHSFSDRSRPFILESIVAAARAVSDKPLYIVAENEKQEIHLALPKAQKGFGFDAVWNEDFHHASFARLTGRNEGYIYDYQGKAQEFVSTAKYGFLYQGQWYRWQKQRRGTPCLDAAPSSFINFLENHDQVANSGKSGRLSTFTSHAAYRVMTTLFLLLPQTPLIFHGQEFGATSPFYYFADQKEKLSAKVRSGRLKFLSQFPSFNNEKYISEIPKPNDKATFLMSKINWSDKKKHEAIFNFHKDLIHLRKNDPVFSLMDHASIDGAVINDDLFLLRYRLPEGERLLIFNFGLDCYYDPAPEPLVAPPVHCHWELLWCSESLIYGGLGFQAIPRAGNWLLSGHTALILFPKLKDV